MEAPDLSTEEKPGSSLTDRLGQNMDTKNHFTGGLPQVSRILVATDFSDQSGRALEWARSLADGVGAKLVLLHVIDIFSLAETGCLMAGSDPLHLLREQAQQRMNGLKRLVPDAETFVHEASPRPTIVDAAVELDCQMIIMGTHGRSGLAHLLLGSVAEYVVRNSKVPVLTVRAHAERS
jgi:nucleotide-binding universal stress UspA family protein